METFSSLLALCARNSPVTGEFPSQRPVTRALMFSSICTWINVWVNNRHCAHYDVIVMRFLRNNPVSTPEGLILFTLSCTTLRGTVRNHVTICSGFPITKFHWLIQTIKICFNYRYFAMVPHTESNVFITCYYIQQCIAMEYYSIVKVALSPCWWLMIMDVTCLLIKRLVGTGCGHGWKAGH